MDKIKTELIPILYNDGRYVLDFDLDGKAGEQDVVLIRKSSPGIDRWEPAKSVEPGMNLDSMADIVGFWQDAKAVFGGNGSNGSNGDINNDEVVSYDQYKLFHAFAGENIREAQIVDHPDTATKMALKLEKEEE